MEPLPPKKPPPAPPPQDKDRMVSEALEKKSIFSTQTRTVSEKLLIKAAELADKKKKEREAHPQRMKYFQPRVYEYWENESAIDDEIKEQAKLMREIKLKEEALKAKKAQGTFDSDDEEAEEALNEQKAVYHRLKTRKAREASYLQRLKAQLEREEEERALKEAERLLSELQNPSKYGWYYGNGYYETDKLFGLKEELLEGLQDAQDEYREYRNQKHPETFTEKFKRHFWPPNLFFKGKCKLFRTRGTYLDFPEVIADFPRQIDVNFERDEQAFLSNTLFRGSEIDENAITMSDLMQEEVEEEEELAAAAGETPEKKIKRMKEKQDKFFGKKKQGHINTGWDQWYYDDDAGEFFPKKEGFSGEYYMDGRNVCWRHKRPPRLNFKRQPTPYDWYYDVNLGQVIARADFLGFEEFEYDALQGVYKVKPAVYSKKLKKLEKKSLRLRFFSNKKEDNKEEVYKPIPPKPLSAFYFDEKHGKWKLKEPDEQEYDRPDVKKSHESIGSGEFKDDGPIEINWDENGHRFTRKWEGEWRGLTGLSPDDYFFDDDNGQFLPKPPRQGKEFKYHPSDGVWRRANQPAPNKLQTKTISTPADYYFDSFQGQFLPKNKDKGAMYDYWLQKYARIYRKHQEPKSGMYPEDYYWDSNRKVWLPRAIRMEMIRNTQSAKNRWAKEITGGIFKPSASKDTPEDFFWDTEQGEFVRKGRNKLYYLDEDGFWKSQSLKNRLLNRTFPQDFFYNHLTKEFQRKSKGEPYIFNPNKNVWVKHGCPQNFELKFYFDIPTEKWVPLANDSSKSLLAGFPVAFNPNLKIPDEYWFDEDYGRFVLKEPEDIPKYYFNPSEGAWKKKGNIGPNNSNLHPRSFYFDDSTGKFKLKIAKPETDYWYDTNNKIYRHVCATGETRNGHQPQDYRWNSDLKSYVLTPSAMDKTRGKITSEKLEWNPQRRYSKGWLPNEPSDEINTKPTPPPPPSRPPPPKKTTFAPKRK